MRAGFAVCTLAATACTLPMRVQPSEPGSPSQAAQGTELSVIPVRAVRSDDEQDNALDDAEFARALERSLVRSGGILLPPWSFEIEPSILYDYRSRSGVVFVPQGIASQDTRVENVVAQLALRTGLPWNSQLELSVPYGYQSIVSITGGSSASSSGWGLGDPAVSLSKELINGNGGRSALIVDLGYQFASDDSDPAPTAATSPVNSFSAGYDVWSVTLTTVKGIDPLVFLGSISHYVPDSTAIGGSEIEPGDTTSVGVQAILAASPDVSLRAGLSLSRSRDARLDGQEIEGSEQMVGMLDFGGSLVLSRSMLLDLSVGIGLTEDSPDIVLSAALPIRFSW